MALLTGCALANTFDVLAASTDTDASGEQIDEIVVVANRTERSIKGVAANITVLNEHIFSAEMATSMSDVLRYVPGIDYEGAGTRFGTEGFNIRGIGGNRVALLVDGVPLSDQFDIGSFSNATRDFVDAGFVRRAEVLHGPASALYGSSAIGGVVALQSPDPTALAGPTGSGGRFATNWRDADSSIHGTAMQAIAGEQVGLLGGISLRDGSEFDSAASAVNLDNRDHTRRSAILKLVAERPSGRLSAGYYAQDSAVQSSLNSMLGNGRFRSTTALLGDDDYRVDLGSLAWDFETSNGWIDGGVVRAYAGKTDIDQRTIDERGNASRPVTIDRRFVFEQTYHGMDVNLQKEIVGDRWDHQLGFGLEYRQRDTEEFRDGLSTGLEDGVATNVILGEAFPLRDFPLSRSVDIGAYIEDTISFGNWTAIAAVRADRYELDAKNDPMYAEDYPFAEPVSISDSEISPKLGLIFHPADSVDLYMQLSHGFRAPPFEDANIGLEIPVFNYRAIPNPDLRSESSTGIEAGFRWRGDSSKVYLSLFQTDYDDFIESKVRLGVDADSGRIFFQSQNINEAKIRGVEGGWSFEFDNAFGVFTTDGAFYWARGENLDDGQPLNTVGPAQAVLGLDWAPAAEGNWHGRLRATLTDGWSDVNEARGPLFKPSGHAVFDVFMTRSFGDQLRLRAGITNLSDRVYWSWSDVRGLSPSDPIIPYLARPGRSLVLGLDMNW